MTREKFIEKLDDKGYSYEIVGDKIVVTHRGDIYLGSLETLPPGVEFRNKKDVWLNSLKTLPSGVEFNNEGVVYLGSLKTLPSGVEFNNEVFVYLGSLIGGWFDDWGGNIQGIDYKRLLNKMVSDGVFDR